MEASGLLGLDDHGRRRIMLALPVPDLLRLSAACRGLRSDMFRLMRGDLAVQLGLSLPSSAASTAVERCGQANEASFRAFLAAGGAPLVKSLTIDIASKPHRGGEALAWPPLSSLESLSVIYSENGSSEDALQLSASGIIATASRLRDLHLSFSRDYVDLRSMLACISSMAATGEKPSLENVSIEVGASRNIGSCTVPHQRRFYLYISRRSYA